MIIGITGTIASGKSVFSDLLEKSGLIRFNFSDEVREECKKRGLVIERRILQDVGNEMREKYGNDYWAQRIISKLKPGKNYVIEGIRNPGEVIALRKLDNFLLMGVDAPVEKRIDWIAARGKDSDPKTKEEIMKIDARDRGEGEDKSGQHVNACFRMADFVIVNKDDMDELRRKATVLLRAFKL